MAHKQQRDYILNLKDKFPEYFSDKKVLEVGSLDINGTCRDFFTNCDYLGIDVGRGKGVDYVCGGHEFSEPSETYDVVNSCECFEHNPYWLETFINMHRLCNKGGLVFFTCATTGREEHGTRRTCSWASPLTLDWDYYKNLEEVDFTSKIKMSDLFCEYRFDTNAREKDLYFYGIKGSSDKISTTYLGGNYNTDKYELGYIDNFYDNFLSGVKLKNILEIGVRAGGSLKLWKAFSPDSNVYGIDKNKFYCKNSKCIIGNAYDVNIVNKFEDNFFDLIIDDGPHTYKSWLDLISMYYKKLKPNGNIVIEDIIRPHKEMGVTPDQQENLRKVGRSLGYKVTQYDLTGKQKNEVLLNRWKDGIYIMVFTK